MSADNGIYIAEFEDGYRAIYASAIDNIDYYKIGTTRWKRQLDLYFGHAVVFETEPEALVHAKMLYKKAGYTEYGICFLGFFKYKPKRNPRVQPFFG